jgi:hypothetical protein
MIEEIGSPRAHLTTIIQHRMWRVVISPMTRYTTSILLLEKITKEPRREMVLALTLPLIHNPGAPSLNIIHMQLNPENS